MARRQGGGVQTSCVNSVANLLCSISFWLGVDHPAEGSHRFTPAGIFLTFMFAHLCYRNVRETASSKTSTLSTSCTKNGKVRNVYFLKTCGVVVLCDEVGWIATCYPKLAGLNETTLKFLLVNSKPTNFTLLFKSVCARIEIQVRMSLDWELLFSRRRLKWHTHCAKNEIFTELLSKWNSSDGFWVWSWHSKVVTAFSRCEILAMLSFHLEDRNF